ncbi:SpoIIE family protein phosphatase [Streptomyces sp. NPDC006617]|uniref:SpoIIE family protein phosphatase n=1 Tax=Streptomyces sp. NPDC006617 TaxID=3155354 RepID=UPI0033A52A2A
MEKTSAGPGGKAHLDTTRLRLISAASEVLSGSALLSLAVGDAVAALNGVGGMGHLRDDRVLRLLATDGAACADAEAWEGLSADSPAVPAVAVQEGHAVWRSLDPGAMGTDMGLPMPGDCVVAVPFAGAYEVRGALTVFLDHPGPPDGGEMMFLKRLAALLSRHLARSPFDETQSQTLTDGNSLRWHPAPEPDSAGASKRNAGRWEWEPCADRVTADDKVIRMAGLAPDTFDDRAATWFSAVHPSDAPAVLTAIEQAVTDGLSFTTTYRIRSPVNRSLRVEAHGVGDFENQGGAPARWVGTVRDVTASTVEQDQIERDASAAPGGALAVDDEWQVVYADSQAERLLGGGRLSARKLWSLAPDIAALRDRCISAAAAGEQLESEISLPGTEQLYRLRVSPGRTGTAVSIIPGRMDGVANRLAEPFALAGWGDRRALLIGNLTEGLAQTLTVRDVVQAMIAHLVPLFGATGLVVAAIDGRRLRVVGSFGYDPSVTDLLDGMTVDALSPAAEVLRDRRPLFVTSAAEYVERYPHLAYLPTLGHKQAWAFLPLIASGRPVGYCALTFDTPRSLVEDERTLLIALSGLVAHAFERARLYDAEHHRAEELQRGLLPRTLPALLAVTAAARYVPAGPGTEVGGDWYDVIPLSSERVALVVGDVTGHGVSEAVTMARLRTAVRTLADLDVPPEELLTRLDGLITTFEGSISASCLYAVYDPTTCVLSFASAGHPPVAFLHPGGSAYFPPLEPNPPLGLALPPFSTVEVVLPPESLIVLYTNGLLQTPATDIDAGLARLGQVLTRTATAAAPIVDGITHLDALCRSVTGTLLSDEPRHDDAVVLIARSHAMDPRDIVSWSLPENPVAAGQARELARNQLADWNLDELSMTTELLVSELVGNVVRHAEGPINLRLLRGRTLICEVSDGSLTTPRIRHAGESDEGGRGLQLVAALAHRWGARFTTTGKCIWTEQRRPGDVAEA